MTSGRVKGKKRIKTQQQEGNKKDVKKLAMEVGGNDYT